MPAFAVVIVLILGAGVGLGAENTVPGDALYPVKVGVNENVRGALIFTAEGKTEWAERRAERRLEEAEELASQGELSADVAADLEARFNAHAAQVDERLAEFKAKENFQAAADLSSKFEASLAAHARALVLLRGEGENADSVDRIVSRVQTQYGNVATFRVQAEAGATAQSNAPSESSLRARIDVLDRHVSDLRNRLEQVGASLSTTIKAEVETKINTVVSAAANAEAKLEANLREESAGLVREAERMIVETRVFLETHKNLNLNLGGNVGGNASSSNATSSTQGESGTTVDTEGGTQLELNLGR